MIVSMAYRFPKRLVLFSYFLIMLLWLVLAAGLYTAPPQDPIFSMYLVALLGFVTLFFVVLLRWRSKKLEYYIEIVEGLKNQLKAEGGFLIFGKDFQLVPGKYKISIGISRATGFMFKRGKFEVEGGPILVNKIDFRDLPIPVIFSQYMGFRFVARGWKLIDAEYENQDIIMTAIPKASFEPMRKIISITDRGKIVDVVLNFRDKDLHIEVQGSPSDKVKVEIYFENIGVSQEVEVRGGEKESIQLLPRNAEPIYMLLHGKSIVTSDVTIYDFRKDLLELLSQNYQRPVLLGEDDIKINVRMGKKIVEEVFKPKIVKEF
ncbi:MAG: hypothetical protein ACP6IP_06650 [Candidatus Njordarchaeia archaeon]